MSDCKDLKDLFRKVGKMAMDISGNIHFFFHYVFHDSRHWQNLLNYLESVRNYINLSYAELWILRIAIQLHDIGLFLSPRYWNEFQISKEDLMQPNNNLLTELKRTLMVRALLDNLKQSFEEAFFDESNYLRLPSPLARKPWDEFNLIEKTAIRHIMRKLHAIIGSRAVVKKFIGTSTQECRKVSEIVGTMVRLHEGKHKEEVKNLGLWDISDSPIDLKKVTALLVMLDAIDCAGVSRASPRTLDEIIDEIRLLEERIIEIERKYNRERAVKNPPEYIAHWIFKRYIKRVDIEPGKVIILTETTEPAYMAGIIFFEIANNVWPKFHLAQEILQEHGFHFDLIVKTPSSELNISNIADKITKLSSIFHEAIVNENGISQLSKGESSIVYSLTLPRTLALLLSHGYVSIANQILCETLHISDADNWFKELLSAIDE